MQKMCNVGETDKLLKIQNLPRLNHDDTKVWETYRVSIIHQKSPNKEFTGEFYGAFKELTPILLTNFQKTGEKEAHPSIS
jgi:hypothetical protein